MEQEVLKMFNLHKWVKSWFSNEDVVKTSSHYNLHLEKARSDFGETSDDQPMIAEKTLMRSDSDNANVTIEYKMNKENKSDSQTLEAQMEDQLTYSVRKEGHREEVPRMSVATAKHDHAYREAYAKAEKELKKQTDLFEKYIGKKAAKKVPANVPHSASGLVNNPERFVNFDGVPGEDVKKNISNISERSVVKPMHSQAELETLKQLDAAAYYVAFKAASNGRDMSADEINIISKIINKKREILQPQR